MRASLVRRTTTVALLALGVSACATLGRQVFEEPVVDFRNVEVKGIGLQGGSLDVVLAVRNPNRFRLDATRLTYRLMVDSVQVGEGALDSRFVVQSNDSALVRLPVNFTYAGLGSAAGQLIRSGAVNYRVLGDFTVNTPLGSFTRPYNQRGRFSSVSGTR